jgi:hypothetical protein
VELGLDPVPHAAREKLIASGVLDRFEDTTGPTIAEEAESAVY